MDALEQGRRLKCLTIVDDFTKEAIDIVVDHGISGQYVTLVLDQAAQFRSLPKVIRTDQGPEFTGKAVDQWAYERCIELRLIQAGKPTQYGSSPFMCSRRPMSGDFQPSPGFCST
jgi:putative transposase